MVAELEECDWLMARQWPGDKRTERTLATLFGAAREGHLCISSSEPLPKHLVDEVEHHGQETEASFVRCKGLLYLKRNWVAESGVVHHWKRLATTPAALQSGSAPLGEDLLDAQRRAIEHVFAHPITLISGGPGTGKTYTSRRLIQAFLTCHPDAEVALAAPTGKAASNLAAGLNVSVKVQTLHGLLHRKQRLSADLILVDESSMMDVDLLHRLLSAVKRGARLVLVGDPNQLPPVEAGSLFADLVARGTYVVELERCMRAEDQSLVTFAVGLQCGELRDVGAVSIEPLPSTTVLGKEIGSRWKAQVAGGSSPERLLEVLRSHCYLSLMRRGLYGVEYLNRVAKESCRGFPVPVLVTANDHKLELYNGEVGVQIGETVYFQGEGEQLRTFSSLIMPRHEPAFCLSVHKSQGSEFQEVTLLLPEGSSRFGRAGLYTAATRAKRSLRILGETEEIKAALAQVARRRSGMI